MDIEAVKKSLASEKLEERLEALTAYQEAEAKQKDLEAKLEAQAKEMERLKEERAKLRDTNQALFLKVGTREPAKSADIMADESKDTISAWISKAKERA